MLWNPQKCQYKLDESDRNSLHEAGHALLNLILLGNTGTVEMNPWGCGAECREYRNPDLHLDTSAQPAAIHRGCVSLAGYCTEIVALGKAEGGGCVYDFKTLDLALNDAREAGLYLDRAGLEIVVKFLIRCHLRSVISAASMIRPNHTAMSHKLTHAMVSCDESGLLADFTRTPVMGPGWRQNWGAIKSVAGKDYARQYLNGRH